MADNKTKPTGESVNAFLDSVENEQRRKDAYQVLEMMREITGEEPKMWGPSMIGFGTYHYKYATGREGDAFIVGFSPRKAALTLYVLMEFDGYEALMSRLGKYTTSKACLYVKRLSDLDQDVLRELITQTYQHMKAQYPTS